MSRIRLIHHVNVPISNRERTREWYEKVLGAEFLDRGSASNARQLQMRLGTGEIHFTERPQPTPTPSSHCALEIEDWDGMMAHLAALGVPHVRTSAASVAANLGGTDPHQGRRDYSGEHYTYLHDPRREHDRADLSPAGPGGLSGPQGGGRAAGAALGAAARTQGHGAGAGGPVAVALRSGRGERRDPELSPERKRKGRQG